MAWVIEQGSSDRRGYPVATGRFEVFIESDDGRVRGPAGISVLQALRWAEGQAQRVLVRYSAPEGEPSLFIAAGRRSDETLPAWPPSCPDLSRRRLPGWEHLDRRDTDPPISWDALVHIRQRWGEAVPELTEAFIASLEAELTRPVVAWRAGAGGGVDQRGEHQNQVDAMPVSARFGGEAARVLFQVTAATVRMAERAAVELAESALSDALHRLRAVENLGSWSTDVRAFPTGTKASAQNLRFDT